MSCAVTTSRCSDCCITTGCCPGQTLPKILHATISGSGSCNGTYTLTYNPANGRWETSVSIGACPTSTKPAISTECSDDGSGNCLWFLLINGSFISGTLTKISCDPLHLQAVHVVELSDVLECNCGGDPTVDITL